MSKFAIPGSSVRLFSAWLLNGFFALALAAPTGPAGASKPYPFQMDVLFHGPRARHQVALTFDACPRRSKPVFSNKTVDFLEQERIPTTFFVSARWARECPECLKRLESEPYFEIALHGYNHLHASELTDEQMASEIDRCQTALARLGANPRPFFRPPYGDRPPALVAVARRLGVLTVMWDVESGDPNPRNTASHVEQHVLTSVRDGSIVVFHVNGGGISTEEALPVIVAGLRERGFTFVTISDLLGQSSMQSAGENASPHLDAGGSGALK